MTPGSFAFKLSRASLREEASDVTGIPPVDVDNEDNLFLTLSQRHDTSMVLLWPTPDYFNYQGESYHNERVNLSSDWLTWSPQHSHLTKLDENLR